MRVAVLEDQVLTRAGIVATLEAAGIDVVAAVGVPDELHRVVALEPVDVALLDVRLPPTYTTEGLDAAARIRREHPRTAVLVLSQHLEIAYAASLLEAAGTGSGYLLKDRVLETATLVDALSPGQRGRVRSRPGRRGRAGAGTASRLRVQRPHRPRGRGADRDRRRAHQRGRRAPAGDLGPDRRGARAAALHEAGHPLPRDSQPASAGGAALPAADLIGQPPSAAQRVCPRGRSGFPRMWPRRRRQRLGP